jgi:bifunctional oligoribonuclease and PAP phosphatase NrnA
MKEITKIQASDFSRFIELHKFFFVAGHKEPDGDCIASCLGIASLLEHFGKQYQLLSAGPFKRTEIHSYAEQFTQNMQFLSESERKQTGLIITDCSEIQRLGDLNGDLKGLDIFIIDHHLTATYPSQAHFIIDDTAPAASCLIQMLYEMIVGPLPQKTAEILFFGLCMDTGFFHFLTEKSANVFVSASRLVAAGANPRITYDKITSGKSFQTRKLLGTTLNRAESYFNGKLIVTYETMDDTMKYGSEGRDSDALYQLLLSVKGVEAVVFLRQETENSCTGGFRSRDSVDVSAVAACFGGGGHKNAAGMSVEGKLETLIPAVCKEFARIL